MKYHTFTVIFLMLFLSSHAVATESAHYRLSYSGLITGYAWKDLADVTLNLTPEQTFFRDQAATRLSMEVTTSNYSLAEAIYALRYRWESILDTSLQRTLLVRVVDEGDSDSHDVYWYQWQTRAISLFHKRKQHDVSILAFDEEPILEWEKNKLATPPEFIDDKAPVADGLSYLIMSKHKKGKLDHDAIDPLSMLMRIRQHNFHTQSELLMDIINEDDLDPYRAYLLGEESLEFNGRMVPALKLGVQRDNQKGEEGLMLIWLSDNNEPLLLRIDIDSPLGMLHLELQPTDNTK